MEIQCEGQAAEIYQKLKTKLTDYKSQGKLSQIKEIAFDDASRSAQASGTGFKSRIQCQDGKVVLDLDLNFMLKPMRGQIEEQVRKTVLKIFS